MFCKVQASSPLKVIGSPTAERRYFGCCNDCPAQFRAPQVQRAATLLHAVRPPPGLPRTRPFQVYFPFKLIQLIFCHQIIHSGVKCDSHLSHHCRIVECDLSTADGAGLRFNLTRGRLPPTQFNYIDPRRRRRRTCVVLEEEGSQSFDLPAVLQPASQSQSQTREGEKGTNGEWRGKRSKRE